MDEDVEFVTVTCQRCKGSGLYMFGSYIGQGSYDFVCDECGGRGEVLSDVQGTKMKNIGDSIS